MAVTSFEEFIDAGLAWRGSERDQPAAMTPAFVSGETAEQGLRAWWAGVAALEVVGPDTYRWTCSCGTRVDSTGALYEWDLTLYALWTNCPACSAEMAG